MKKKLSLLLCLVSMVLSLVACSGDPTKVDYYGATYSDLETVAVANVSQLASFTQEELAIVATSVTDELTLKLIEGWMTTTTGLGEFQGLGDFVINKANGTVTVDQYVNYVGRQVVVSFVWEYDYEVEQLVVEDITVDLVYTLNEKLEKAALNTAMGMGIVFAVLAFICVIIYCLKFVNGDGNKKKESTSAQASMDDELLAVITAAIAAADQSSDLELVAVITAAISASTGKSADNFRVTSITRR